MEQVIFRPRIYKYDTFKEYAQEKKISHSDLFIVAGEFIYDLYLAPAGISRDMVISQEKYGIGEPSDVMVEEILSDIRGKSYERVIGIGGGAILDIAKVVAVADTAEVDPLYDNMAGLKKKAELILLPTTCGTGSEVTCIAVLNRTRIGTKMGLQAEALYADEAIMIPELLSGLPYRAFASSAIDALVHATESMLSPKTTPYTEVFAREAIKLILSGFKHVAENGQGSEKERMEEFLIASNFAGLAFGTAGVGTVHAMAYPLGGVYHVSHGESNYAVFTGVLRKYIELRPEGAVRDVMELIAGELGCSRDEALTSLEELLEKVMHLKRLKDHGMSESDVPVFAGSVIENQQRLLVNSYVPVDEAMVAEIYTSLL